LPGAKAGNGGKWLKIQPLTLALPGLFILPVGYTKTTMGFVDLYDGFIFDYGKVLVTEPAEAERAKMAGIVGISLDAYDELYWRDRLDYDKGLQSAMEYWQEIAKAAGKVLTLDQVERLSELDAASWMHFDEVMWEFVAELKAAGKRVAILSNMPRDLGEMLRARTTRFAGFDHVTLSYEVKSVKPEAAIYEDCLRGIGTELKRTVFFDDKIANVKGAEMLGLAAVEFLDRDAVLGMVRG
jgi:putative hydrolase of the HAD superfamily